MNAEHEDYFADRLGRYIDDNPQAQIFSEDCRAGFEWALDFMHEKWQGIR